MKNNIGIVDRIFRIAIGIGIAILYAVGFISGTTALFLIIPAVIFIVTSLVGVCPLYSVCKISTKQQSESMSGV